MIDVAHIALPNGLLNSLHGRSIVKSGAPIPKTNRCPSVLWTDHAGVVSQSDEHLFTLCRRRQLQYVPIGWPGRLAILAALRLRQWRL